MPAWLLAAIPGAVSFVSSIGTLITGLIGSMMAYMATMMGVRLAIRVAGAAVIFTLFLSLLVTIDALMSGLLTLAPTWWSVVQTWIVPSNFSACVSAMLSARIAFWFWHWKRYYLELLAYNN